VKARDEKLEALTAGIKPMVGCVGFTPSEGATLLPSDLPPRPIVDQCQMAWVDFMEFTHSAAQGAVVHALTVVWSHYPSVKPEVIMIGYVRGMNLSKIEKLENKAEEAAVKLARDVYLFGEGQDNAQ